jgi:uncharacterized protein (DUF1919 family)
MNAKYKVLIWGTGIDYDRYLNNIKYEELKKNMNVVAVVSKDTYYKKIDGYPVIRKEEIINRDYDYIIVASINKYDQILDEALTLGIERKRLLKVTIFNINNFDFKRYIKLYSSNISIISSNCWGGITYNYLGMEFLSPFINMYEEETDYLKLLANLDFYLKQPLVFDKEMYEINSKRNFPVAMLGDIRLYFNHYANFDEAKAKWYKRLSRINCNNLFIMYYTMNLENAKKFDNLPFEHKIVFLPFKSDLPSAIELDVLNDVLVNECDNEFYRLVNSLAYAKFKYYDVMKLLCNEPDNKRVSL